LGQQVFIDPRLVVKSFEKGKAHEPQKIEVTRPVHRKESQMIGALSYSAFLVEPTSGSDIDLTPHDGFYPVLNGFLIEFDRAKHVPVIGQGHGPHLVFPGQFQHLVKPDGSIQEAVLAVDMKMDKIRMLHHLKIL
jgi:hypothetical protein